MHAQTNIFDDLDHLIKCTNKKVDVSAVIETRITKQTSLTTNINPNNYSFEFTPAESVLYIFQFYFT